MIEFLPSRLLIGLVIMYDTAVIQGFDQQGTYTCISTSEDNRPFSNRLGKNRPPPHHSAPSPNSDRNKAAYLACVSEYGSAVWMTALFNVEVETACFTHKLKNYGPWLQAPVSVTWVVCDHKASIHTQRSTAEH